jgi:hypothetical protein
LCIKKIDKREILDMEKLYCYDNEIIKWTYGDNLYCLHIQHDDVADNNPRWWDDHDSVMACFHPRYRLGDKVDASTPEEFWNNLVYEMCEPEEIINALINKKTIDVIAEKSIRDDTYYLSVLTDDGEYTHFCQGLKENEIPVYAEGELSIKDCQILLDTYIVWLPLWLHDHSSLSMDCDTRFRGSWDDSNVGWIVTKVPSGSDVYKTEAERIMRDEVKTYSDYLSGENYGYTLYKEEHGEWKEIDRAFGFIGSDVLENGITYSAGCGLEKALKEDRCRIGDAEKVVTITYNFDKC